MTNLKSIRIIMIVVGFVFAGSLLIPFFNQPATTGAALLATAPPRDDDPAPPPSDPGGSGGSDSDSGGSADENGDSDDEPRGAIQGQVIDLSTEQPGRGLEIDINGNIVRTDSEGRYSLTGLRADRYQVVLLVPDQAIAVQNSVTVSLTDNETATVDLEYYSQTPPTPSPTYTPEPEPTPEPTPTTAVEPEVGFDPEEEAAEFSPLTPPTGDAPALFLNPSHINNEKGVAGNITIDVSNVSDLGAFQAILEFNPKVIEIEEVMLGNFLESTGRQANPLITEIDNTAGEVSFVAYTSGRSAGPNGGGTLAVVNFISKQEGISPLKMEDVVLVARLGKNINASIGEGRVSVNTCFGDLNRDDVIDVSDLQAVAGRVGQSAGDPNYVLTYDLDNNRLINEADVALITERLYETCP